jgi:hypothetical protein
MKQLISAFVPVGAIGPAALNMGVGFGMDSSISPSGDVAA